MEKLFIAPTFESPVHTEFAAYIIDSSKVLYYEGRVNNIFSTEALFKSLDYFKLVLPFVKILNDEYGKRDERVEQINTLFVKVTITHFYTLLESFATSTLSTTDQVKLLNNTNIESALSVVKDVVNKLNDFAITSWSKTYLEEVIEYRAQCIIIINSIKLGIDTPKRFKPQSEIKSSPKKKEGCYLATMVYHSYDAPQVIKLRNFRDTKLKPYLLGRLFISTYYKISPRLVIYLTPYQNIHKLIREALSLIFNLNS